MRTIKPIHQFYRITPLGRSLPAVILDNPKDFAKTMQHVAHRESVVVEGFAHFNKGDIAIMRFCSKPNKA